MWKRLLLRRRARRLYLLVPVLFIVGVYVLQNSALSREDTSSSGSQLVIVDEETTETVPTRADFEEDPHSIPPECACTDNESGIVYNFCYSLRWERAEDLEEERRMKENMTASPSSFSPFRRGTRFDCVHLPTMRKLGLLDARGYVHLDESNRTIPLDKLKFVVAASDSHLTEAQRAIGLIQKYMPGQKIVFYDLGSSETNVETMKAFCNTEYRRFRFDDYPEYVRQLFSFRWKPLLIAEALRDFGAVWYMDSSVVLFKGDLKHVYELLRCKDKAKPNSYRELLNETDARVDMAEESLLHDAAFIESGWHIDRWLRAIANCDKFAYMLQGFTGHGIFSATHPGVYKFLPTNEVALKRRTNKMYEAGFAFVVRTVEVVHDVLKWYVLCALEADCMAPPGAHLGCAFQPDRFAAYAGCHRFDQSVINLLLANRNGYDSYYYTSGIVDFFHIVRGGAAAPQEVPSVCQTGAAKTKQKAEGWVATPRQ